MKTLIKFLKTLWIVFVFILSIYPFVFLPDYFKVYLYFDFLSKSSFEMGELTTQRLYHNAYSFMIKLPPLIYSLTLVILSFSKNIIYKNDLSQFYQFPKIMYDYKILMKTNTLFFIFHLIILLLFLNVDFNLNIIYQFLIYFILLFVNAFFIYKFQNKITHKVTKRMKIIEENEFQDVHLNEYETVVQKDERKFVKLALITCLFLMTSVSVFNYYRYRNLELPEVLIIDGDDQMIENFIMDDEEKICQYSSNKEILCSVSYKNEVLFENYQLSKIEIFIQNPELQEGIDSGIYTLSIYSPGYIAVNQIKENNHYLFTFENSIQNTYFRLLSIRVDETSSKYQYLTHNDIEEIKITLIRK